MHRLLHPSKHLAAATAVAAWIGFLSSPPSFARQSAPATPNILVNMADDIGYWNISAYSRGQRGYRRPNIDRIANEGAILTDYYGHQSPMRTGLLKVGLPGAKEGLSHKDPTLAELLKPLGYVTGQIRQEPSRRPQRVPTDHAWL